MKKIGNWVIALTVVALVGFIPASALAQWDNFANEKNVLVEAVDTLKNATNVNTNIIYTTTETLGVNYFIQLTLTGGALFAITPTLTSGTGSVGYAGGGAGQNFVKFLVTGAIPNGIVLTLYSNTADIFDVSKVGIGNQVDILIDFMTSSNNPVGSTARSYQATTGNGKFLFVGISASTVKTVPRTHEVKVLADNGPYTKFAANLVTTIPLTEIALKNNGGDTTVPNNVPFAAKKILFKLSGDFEGIAKIQEKLSINTGTKLIGSDENGDTTDGERGKFLINETKDAAYAVNESDLGAGNTINAAAMFFLDGVTSQLARSFELCIYKLEEATKWTAYDMLPCEVHYTIIRNGSSAVLLNIPGGGLDATLDQGFVRISNPSNNAGKVFATMWDMEGNVIGEANTVLIDSLAPLATKVLSNVDLQNKVGKWEKRARMEIFSETTDLGVMGLIRSGDNLQNMSTGGGQNWRSN